MILEHHAYLGHSVFDFSAGILIKQLTIVESFDSISRQFLKWNKKNQEMQLNSIFRSKDSILNSTYRKNTANNKKSPKFEAKK